MKKFAVLLAIGLLLCALSPAPTRANLIGPGTGPVLPDIFLVNTFGAIVADTGVVPFLGAGGAPVKGRFREIVVIDTVSGHLDFLYEITNDGVAGVNDTVGRFTATNFSGVTTDVGYATDSVIDLITGLPHIAPATVGRSGPPGPTVGWDYPGFSMTYGTDSDVMVIKTNVDIFTLGGVSVIDGGSANIAAFGPIPEPATMLLLGSGLLGMGIFARRRFKK